MNVNVQKILIGAILVSYLGLETSAAAIGGPFKCGSLECPNGSICNIEQKPSDDKKTITITKQCKDADGTVLSEEITVEDVPEGKIPFSSIKRTTVNGDTSGGYYGSSSYAAKSITSKVGEDGKTVIDFIPVDVENLPKIDFNFDKIWSFVDKQTENLKETIKDFVKDLFVDEK